MKHSFNSNRKYLLLVLGMTLCTMCNCRQSKAPQVATDVVADSAAVDTCTADDGAVDTCTTSSSKTSSSASSSTETSESLGETAYKAGYEAGKGSIVSLNGYTRNNEEYLKETFVRYCQNEYEGMKAEYRNNRSLYKEFRRGLLKAFEDAENAKNAL